MPKASPPEWWGELGDRLIVVRKPRGKENRRRTSQEPDRLRPLTLALGSTVGAEGTRQQEARECRRTSSNPCSPAEARAPTLAPPMK